MNLSRIATMIYRDYLIFIKSKWRWLEFFYFPITSVIIWGFFAIWTGSFASIAGKLVLVINVFWSYAYIVQSTINLSINEDGWHGEIHHIFLTGMGKWEYLLARIIFSLLISLANLLFILFIAHLFFFDITSIISQVIILLILTAFASVTLAILIAGLYFTLGRTYSWLAWSSLQFFVLLSFPLSPLEILPHQFQIVARLMPYGSLFQAVRNVLFGKPYMQDVKLSLLVNFIYFVISIFAYKFGFDYSRKSGKFAKMF
jgi:hypothetical protein